MYLTATLEEYQEAEASRLVTQLATAQVYPAATPNFVIAVGEDVAHVASSLASPFAAAAAATAG